MAVGAYSDFDARPFGPSLPRFFRKAFRALGRWTSAVHVLPCASAFHGICNGAKARH